MHRGKSARRMRRFAARGMKRTLKQDRAQQVRRSATADRRHRENPHGDKVREVSAAFAENRPPRFEARATLPGSQQRLPRAGIGTRAAPAHRMVLPIRFLQLCRAAHLHLSPEDAERKIRLAVASVWSVIVESEVVCK